VVCVTPAVFHQLDPTRKNGAVVNIHMTCRQFLPTFKLKDSKNNHVVERDVEPYREDDNVFIAPMIAM